MYNETFSAEIQLRINKIANALIDAGVDALLISDNANLYYTSGRVFSGYTLISKDGDCKYFVKRPVGLNGDNVKYIRKPEQISEILGEENSKTFQRIAFDLDTTPYNDIKRLATIFPDAEIVNGSAIMRQVRAVKTSYELQQLKESGTHHDRAYQHIKSLYRDRMTDAQLQIEIEHALRSEGCLGMFRIAGQSMEIFMGNLICGDNADTPTPYDFAMGGGGLSSSLPVGCNGTVILPGMTIMVDMGGNFNGYMTDMTRVFYLGTLSPLAEKAHNLSIAIHNELMSFAHSGVAASAVYEKALEIVKAADMEEYFMGYSQKAGFVGHGLGIEINELPVLAPRSRDILECGNVIAIEPKFVIPHVGAVGIESTYIVGDNGLECITNFPQKITPIL